MVFIAVTDTMPITIHVVVSNALSLLAQSADSAIFEPSVKLMKSFSINYLLGLYDDRITFINALSELIPIYMPEFLNTGFLKKRYNT